jgi:hypothetical protein
MAKVIMAKKTYQRSRKVDWPKKYKKETGLLPSTQIRRREVGSFAVTAMYTKWLEDQLNGVKTSVRK